MPLTDIVIRSAKPKEKPQRLFDGGGLYLEIAPTGGKWWRLKYRFHGKEKRLSLGVYPVVPLKEAREKRDTAKKLLAAGTDPSAARKAEAGAVQKALANSLEAVARAWFADISPNWKVTHSSKVIRRLELYVFPYLGNTPIAEVTAPLLRTYLLKISSLDQAHRTRDSLSQIFRYAIAMEMAERDPAADLRDVIPIAPVTNFAAPTEPEAVGAMLRAFSAFTGTAVVGAALRLAPLLFVRPGELRKALWSDVDFANAEWRFKASKRSTRTKKGGAKLPQKTADHIVSLSNQAVSILADLHPLTCRSEYVFPGARSATRPMSDSAVNAALRRLGFDTQEEITGHGFRAMARTLLHERLHFAPEAIEHQLAHTVPDPLGTAYNRTRFLDERRTMMQAWADYLDQLTLEKPDRI